MNDALFTIGCLMLCGLLVSVAVTFGLLGLWWVKRWEVEG